MARSAFVSRFGRGGILLLKLGITCALVGYLLTRTDSDKYFAIVRDISPVTLLTVLAIVIFQMAVISALRLKLMLKAFGASIKFVRSVYITWCGFFVEQAGAVFIAGDFARILLLRQVRSTVAIEAPLLDRVIGLLTIGTLAAAGMPYIWREMLGHQRDVILLLSAVVGLAMVALLIALLILYRLGQWPDRLSAGLSKTKGLLARLFTIPGARRQLACVLLLAFATHSLNVLVMQILLGATGAEISLATSFMITPTVMLVSMIPASIAGWGVREGAFVVALHSYGLGSEEVLTASILFGLCVLIASLPGAVGWLIVTSRRNVAAEPATEGGGADNSEFADRKIL